MSGPSSNKSLIEALRSTLQRLETSPEAAQYEPELQNLKDQIIAALADYELREQTAGNAPPTPRRPAAAALAELLHAERPAPAAPLEATPLED